MSQRILVVDDSAMMRKIVQKSLKEIAPNATFIEAGDGAEALESFKKDPVDLVLTDWNMPNMAGIDLVRELRKLDPDKKVPIIMVTSEATAEKVKEAVVAGVNNYISKPFTPDLFKEKVGPFLS